MSEAGQAFLAQLYPDVAPEVRSGTLDADAASAAARAAIAERVPTVVAAFGFGSVFAGEARAYSDVDVIAFVPEALSVTNYCVLSWGVPVDLHLVGLDAVPALIAHARRSGICSVLSAVAKGRILLDPEGVAEPLRAQLAAAWAIAPPRGAEGEIRALRWTITSQLADLAQDRPADEHRAAALTAHAMLVRLHHLARGGWRDRGKWTVRQDDRMLRTLTDSYASLFAHDDPADFLAAALAILNQAGGPLGLGRGNRLDLTGAGDEADPS